MRSLTRSILILILISGGLITPLSSSNAEDCPRYDLGNIFYDEFYPDLRWNFDNARVLRWTTDVAEIEGLPVARPFTPEQSEWMELAFKSWDMTSDKITTKRVGPGQDHDVKVGLVVLPDPNNHGFWNVAKSGGYRGSGAVRLNADSRYIKDREYFLEVAQSEVGNMLGLGDISDKLLVDSVMMDPDLPPWGSYPLSDYDIGLIREFYEESTCKSSWPQELKDLKAKQAKDVADAAAQVKALEDAKLKAEAELAARLAEAAKATPTPTPKPTSSTPTRRTITCVKGKIVKKVTSVNPKCPTGFKKK